MPKPRFFLAKTEPDVYSIADLERDTRTVWDGVRNAQARIAMRLMRPGDFVFIYHSGGVSAIVGLARAASSPVDSPNDPKMTIVELEYIATLSEPVTLKEVKESGQFDDFALVRQSRLSTMEVPAKFAAWLKKKRPEWKKLV